MQYMSLWLSHSLYTYIYLKIPVCVQCRALQYLLARNQYRLNNDYTFVAST